MKILSWRFVLRAIAVLSWIISIFWLIFEPGFDPLLAFLGGTATFLGSFAVPDAPIRSQSPDDPAASQRNRRLVLQLVKNYWVKSVLEKSLSSPLKIEVAMEQRDEAVERPWLQINAPPVGPSHPPLPDKNLLEIFDQASQALLILGEPGSGKTTKLLELARDLIARAEQDLAQPIPIVLSLSSWGQKRASFGEWIVDEISAKYVIPKQIIQAWIASEGLLLLLDGLDEVVEAHREGCVKAINAFRQSHLVPLAICSRSAAYEMLVTRLKLNGAIYLQPLTPQQVDRYLEEAGMELSAIQEVLKADQTLYELVRSPLMLSILAVAYAGGINQKAELPETLDGRRKQLFAAYVRRMFAQRKKPLPYPKELITRQLSWMARRMVSASSAVFLIEELQPSWIFNRSWQRIYLFVSRGAAWLLLAIFVLATGGLLSIGVSAGFLATGMIVGLLDADRYTRAGKKDRATEAPSSRRVKFSNLSLGLLAGAGGGLVQGLIEILVWGPTYGRLADYFNLMASLTGKSFWERVIINAGTEWDLIDVINAGYLWAILYGLLAWLYFGRKKIYEITGDIQTTEAIGWSWRSSILGGRLGLGIGLFLGILFGGMIGLDTAQDVYWGFGISYEQAVAEARTTGLFVGGFIALAFILAITLLGALLGGISGRKIVIKTRPNQGIFVTMRNAALVALVVAPFVTAAFVSIQSRSQSMVTVFSFGFLVWMLVALGFGGIDVIKHFTLRFVLFIKDRLSLTLSRFLDLSAELIFLRKVGGGYIFIHRLLLEHFAGLPQEQR